MVGQAATRTARAATATTSDKGYEIRVFTARNHLTTGRLWRLSNRVNAAQAMRPIVDVATVNSLVRPRIVGGAKGGEGGGFRYQWQRLSVRWLAYVMLTMMYAGGGGVSCSPVSIVTQRAQCVNDDLIDVSGSFLNSCEHYLTGLI